MLKLIARPLLVPGLLLAVAACGPTASPSPPATPAATSTPPAAAVVAPPSPVAAERVDGTVQSIANGNLVLSTGRSITLPLSVRVTRSTAITAADLHPGDYVAITAKRQPDNTLLASIVNVFPPSLGQVAPGQRPLPEGNLMTNASIDQIEGNTFTVSFPGGGARVQLAPNATITRQTDATLQDVQAGETITAQVVDGAARTLTINAT